VTYLIEGRRRALLETSSRYTTSIRFSRLKASSVKPKPQPGQRKGRLRRWAMSSDVSTGQEDTRDDEGIMRRLILQTGISIDGYVAALACRSTLTLASDRASMTALWERSEDGTTWQPWMDIAFTRHE
jgi:hypothetical protein